MPLDSTQPSKREFSVVGTRPLRPDGIDKVTGRARFGADATAPGMLVGRILRSPHAHARIRKIDTAKAEKLAGVKAIVTRNDFPDHTDGDTALYDVLYNIMAREKALYEGHAVAAVAAVDARTARDALKLIKIDYEVLPHVTVPSGEARCRKSTRPIQTNSRGLSLTLSGHESARPRAAPWPSAGRFLLVPEEPAPCSR